MGKDQIRADQSSGMMDNAADGSAISDGGRSKVARLIDDYELEGAGAELEER